MRLSSALADRTKARATPGVLLPAVKQNMLSSFMKGNDRRWDIIHPSELSHQKTFCPRAVYMRITEGPLPPEKFDWGTQNIFDEGHTIHAKWQRRLREATPLWGDWRCVICDYVEHDSLEPDPYSEGQDDQCWHEHHIWEYIEVSLNAEDEWLMAGHADGGAWTTLAEIKSVGEGTVRIEDPALFKAADGDLKLLWRDLTRPFKTHVNQVDVYLAICKLRGLPFTSAEFIYECKWNQAVKNFTVQYSEERSSRLVDQARAIKYAVDNDEEPACRFPEGCDNCKPYDERRLTKEG
jgi:hypothetical protein